MEYRSHDFIICSFPSMRGQTRAFASIMANTSESISGSHERLGLTLSAGSHVPCKASSQEYYDWVFLSDAEKKVQEVLRKGSHCRICWLLESDMYAFKPPPCISCVGLTPERSILISKYQSTGSIASICWTGGPPVHP